MYEVHDVYLVFGNSQILLSVGRVFFCPTIFLFFLFEVVHHRPNHARLLARSLGLSPTGALSRGILLQDARRALP